MADFCGLTRVKTWRWSRLFACAVAVFCVIFPQPSLSDAHGYVCSYAYAACNPGFLLTHSAGAYNADSVYTDGWNSCVSCPQGYYKVRKDNKTSVADGTNFGCIQMPSHAVDSDDQLKVSVYYYGRPVARCGRNYYREWKDSSHTEFKCESCGTGYDKPADTWDSVASLVSGGNLQMTNDGVVNVPASLLGVSQCYGHCADNYYVGLDNKCYACDNTTMSNCGTNNTKAADITCVAGYYKTYNGNTVQCVRCPKCYTTLHPDNTAATTAEDACTICDTGDASCFELPETGDGKYYCAQCPTNTTNVLQCGGSDNKKLLCKNDYFRVVMDGDNGLELNTTCEHCEGFRAKAPDKDEENWVWWDEDAASEVAKCSTCQTGYYRVNEWRLNLDDAYCHKCPDGASCAEGSNGNEGYINCPNNTYLTKSCKNSSCSSPSTPTEKQTADKNRGYACTACPVFSGRIKSSNPSADNNDTRVTGLRHYCPICTEGYYGEIPYDINNVSACHECPKFVKLDSMGICFRGRTNKPKDNDTRSSFGKNGFNTVAQCFVTNPHTQVVWSRYISQASYANEYSEYTADLNPTFTDTMGKFEFVQGSSKSCDASSLGAVTNYNEGDLVSGICTPPAGETCVYVNASVGTGFGLNNSIACMRAIMWRSKGVTSNGTDNYTVSDTVATDILRHWGVGNPWFCGDAEKAEEFRNCLVGGEGASDECFWNGTSCVSGNNTDKIVKCTTNGEGGCE